MEGHGFGPFQDRQHANASGRVEQLLSQQCVCSLGRDLRGTDDIDANQYAKEGMPVSFKVRFVSLSMSCAWSIVSWSIASSDGIFGTNARMALIPSADAAELNATAKPTLRRYSQFSGLAAFMMDFNFKYFFSDAFAE